MAEKQITVVRDKVGDDNDSQTKKTDYNLSGVLHVTKEGVIVGISDDAVKLLDYPLDFHFLGKSVSDIFMSIAECGWESIIEALEIKSPRLFTGVFKTHFGDFSEIHCLSAFEVGANVVDLYLIEKDSGSSKYIDKELSRLELYDAFFNTALLDINIKDTNSKYLATSKLFDETFGLPAGVAVGKTPVEIFPAAFSDHITSHDKTVLSGEKVVTQIDNVPLTDQQLLVQKFPLYNKDNSKIGIGVVVVDVTASKISEQRTMEAKNKYKDFFELSTDVLFEVDLNWNIVDSNITGVSSVSKVRLDNDSNLREELFRISDNHEQINSFFESITKDKPGKMTLGLNNGTRVYIAMKFDRSGSNLYRGLLKLLTTI